MDSKAPLLDQVAEAATSHTIESPNMTPQSDEAMSSNSTPRKHIDSKPLPTDSLITIPLSDSDQTRPPTIDGIGSDYAESFRSHEEHRASWRDSQPDYEETGAKSESGESANADGTEEMGVNPDQGSSGTTSPTHRSRSGSLSSDESIQVDWERLDKTEEAQDAETDSDEVCLPLWIILCPF